MNRRPPAPRLTERLRTVRDRVFREEEIEKSDSDSGNEIDETYDRLIRERDRARNYGSIFEAEKMDKFKKMKREKEKMRKSQKKTILELTNNSKKSDNEIEVIGKNLFPSSLTYIRKSKLELEKEKQPLHDIPVFNPSATPSKPAFEARTRTLSKINKRRNPPDIDYRAVERASSELIRNENIRMANRTSAIVPTWARNNITTLDMGTPTTTVTLVSRTLKHIDNTYI